MHSVDWLFCITHNCPCRVLDEETLWGQVVCRVWLPSQDAVVRVPKVALRPLTDDQSPDTEAFRIGYVAAAAKVAEVLEGDTGGDPSDGHVLLAPMESNVIPLPHQVHALSRAVHGDRMRYLLADEVGLGKTIEAGLVMRELKLRGLVRRTLVVAPKGLATQWVAEMDQHFNETFRLVLGEDIGTIRRLALDGDHRNSPWTMFDQVIVSLDSVKPMDRRRGWSTDRLAAYNRDRFEDLITAGWDLVIVDEAHRLGGSTEQVARYKLGRGLSEAAPYLLLLSATPHQGKSDAFQRLMSLLDESAFPDAESVSRDRVAPYVIRTEKRRAVDADGKPLFKPRRTQMVPVKWQERHHHQQLLYEAVTDYVREGYNQAMSEKKRHVGFLMILMQRLVVSSTRAIRTTLERRLEAVRAGAQQASERLAELEDGIESTELMDDIFDMDGQELLDELLKTHMAALTNESRHVQTLLDAARQCERSGPDAKAEALIEWIYQLQADERETDLKVLIFTEFVPTQKMLQEFLEARGISVVTLNGSMDMDERKRAQTTFRGDARVLISTDAGGEGLNLQFCHVVVNFDIPWNPMRLEQRIGRVDRIGQSKTVRALNLVFEDSVEFRVREVLEQKLSVILEEFGIDKTGDVLDSAEAGELFEGVFTAAIVNPDLVNASVEQTMTKVRDAMRHVRESSAIYGISEDPDLEAAERLRSHPLPHWLERMTVSYLRLHGGVAEQTLTGWELQWPNGDRMTNCVFRARDVDQWPNAMLLNLENSQVRGLALNLPLLAQGQPVPTVSLPGLPSNVTGYWGLFEIRLQTGTSSPNTMLRMPETRRGFIAVFMNDSGKIFLPTARHIWDAMQTADPQIRGTLDPTECMDAHNRLHAAAVDAGQELFDSLRRGHEDALVREEERGMTAFAARRRAIQRLGLPEVRQYRTAQCDADETSWREGLDAAREVMPELRPLLLLRIAEGEPR